MGFLFGATKIEGDELRQCLAYLEEEWKLVAFQEKEANLYSKAFIDYYTSMSEGIYVDKELLKRAANRLARAAREIIRRRDKMSSIPDAVSSTYLAYQQRYSDYLAWTEAQVTVVSSFRVEIKSERLQEILLQSEKSRDKAIGEEKKFLKRLKLTGSEVQKIYNNALVAVEAENWQPKIPRDLKG